MLCAPELSHSNLTVLQYQTLQLCFCRIIINNANPPCGLPIFIISGNV